MLEKPSQPPPVPPNSSVLEKPTQPPPSRPSSVGHPPPIGFNVLYNPVDASSDSPLPYPVTNEIPFMPCESNNPSNETNLNTNSTNELILSQQLKNSNKNNNHMTTSLTTSILSNASNSSSSSQEMLNSPNNTLTKASQKPVVPRRPGNLVAAHISKFQQKANNDVDLIDNCVTNNEPSVATKSPSEITSL
jgi:hypothetical protein